MNSEDLIKECCAAAVSALYGVQTAVELQVTKTRKEFSGDYTLVTFPLLSVSRKKPEETGEEIGKWVVEHYPELVAEFNVIKGFLNLSLTPGYWLGCLAQLMREPNYGFRCGDGRTVMVEYSSPNTNKPLHLGHIRNNLLGYSVARILEAAGANVVKVNLVNDRGIHICKSMLAWLKFGGAETPQSTGIKGDHLVGKYYVAFDQAYKAEVKALMNTTRERIKEIFERLPANMENDQKNRWNLLDYGDVVVHILHKEERETYALEKFWNNAFSIPESEWKKLSQEYSAYVN